MFKAIKRIGQGQKDVVVSLTIDKVGLMCTQDATIVVEWQRGRAIDKTPEVKLKMQGDKKEAQALETHMHSIFRKKSTMYFSGSEVQKKVCNFIVKVKKINGNWVEFNQEYDFSAFATKDMRDQEHKIDIKFKASPSGPEYKDAYISAKILIVEFKKDDKDQMEWIEQAQKTMGQKGTLFKSAVPSISQKEQQLAASQNLSTGVSEASYEEKSIEKFAVQNMRVIV